VKNIVSLVLCSVVLLGQARQLHTIKSGSWESDSVWYNQMIPTANNDTILIQHYISIHSDKVLNNNDFLHIAPAGSVCGNCNLAIIGSSTLLNEGFLGLYYFEIDNDSSYNYPGGYIDLGDSGMVVQNNGFFEDTGGCLLVHTGPQLCL